MNDFFEEDSIDETLSKKKIKDLYKILYINNYINNKDNILNYKKKLKKIYHFLYSFKIKNDINPSLY